MPPPISLLANGAFPHQWKPFSPPASKGEPHVQIGIPFLFNPHPLSEAGYSGPCFGVGSGRKILTPVVIRDASPKRRRAHGFTYCVSLDELGSIEALETSLTPVTKRARRFASPFLSRIGPPGIPRDRACGATGICPDLPNRVASRIHPVGHQSVERQALFLGRTPFSALSPLSVS